jgi:hypothetical protein
LELGFVRRAPFQTIRIKEITGGLQISQITDFTEYYRRKWNEHIDRLCCDGIPRKALKRKKKFGKPSEDGRILFYNIHNRSQ